MMQEVLNFSVSNSTNGTIPVSLFGNDTNPNDNANANIQYFWNVTGFTISFESQILIQYKTPTQLSFSTTTLAFTGTSIQDVVNALNTLNLGVFFITTSGGNTYINNYNVEYQFGQLLVIVPSIIDPSFIIGSGFDSDVNIISIQNDGKIIVGGNYNNYNGVSANYIIRLNNDGSIDPTFVYGAGFDSQVTCLSIQSDNSVYVGGNFTNYDGNSANSIVKLNSNGSIDPTFNYGNGFNNGINTILTQTNNKIIVGGAFTNYDITAANGIIRLNTNGSVDGTFVYGTGFIGNVLSGALQTDGKILLGGTFTSYNGTGANRIIRLNTNGSVDGTFVYGTGFAGGNVLSIVVQTDGKILLGGTFTSYNGTGANRIIRLNANGSIDGTFVYGSGFDSGVLSIKIQTDGKILVGGGFGNYNGSPAIGFVRLNTNGSIDTSYNTGSGFNGAVETIAIQTDTKILVGGAFTTVLGENYNSIVRLFPVSP